MVRTMRKVRKERKESKSTTPTPGRKDSARLRILRSSSGFTPVNANSAVDRDCGSGAESEELPPLRQGLQRREDAEGSVAKADVSRDDEDEGEGDDEGKGGGKNGGDYGDEESDGGDKYQEISEAENQPTAAKDDEENDEDNGSSNLQDTNAVGPTQATSKRSSPNIWDEPKDTHRLLDLLEQIAMRDHYVNTRTGSWKNNAFGMIGEKMGKDSKVCNNKYLTLKYKYLEILALLDMNVGLEWDDQDNEIVGSDEAWGKVRDQKLLKLSGRKFLYKEEMDNLNSVLNFAAPLEMKTAEKKGDAAGKVLNFRGPKAGESSTVTGGHQGGDEGDVASELVEESGEDRHDTDEDRAADEVNPNPSSDLNSASADKKPSCTPNRRSEANWFGLASIHKLVQLLVEYVQDDHYIVPICKTWKNAVFKEIAAKIGKHQGVCQNKYMNLRDAYVEIDKLLKSNLGFKWDPEKNEVIGSNETWAQVKDTNLIRRRHRKFLFKEEFAKLAEKLDFEPREYAPRRSLERTRISGRTFSSRPSYVKRADEVYQSVGDEGHSEGDVPDQACKPPGKKRLFSDTFENRQPVEKEDHVESDLGEDTDEPPSKRRLLSDTYEKRREAFYVAATTVSAKRDELKAMVESQLAIQREQVAIHKEQIAALHAQLTMENKLSKSLEECHLKDSRRRDDLEGWRATAKERLQNETCLTPHGMLTMIKTLRNLRSNAEGYLGIMSLDPCLRRLWLKAELEKMAIGELSDYYSKENVGDTNDEPSTGKVVDEDSGFSLVDQEFEFGEDDTLSAKDGCENRHGAVGVHFEGDGWSSDPVERDHIPIDEEPEDQHAVENIERLDEADPFEIDPYISVEDRQDEDIVAGAEKELHEEEADEHLCLLPTSLKMVAPTCSTTTVLTTTLSSTTG